MFTFCNILQRFLSLPHARLVFFLNSARSRSHVTDPEQPPSAHWEYLSFSALVSSSSRRGSFLTAKVAKIKAGPVRACAGTYCILPLSPFCSDLFLC